MSCYNTDSRLKPYYATLLMTRIALGVWSWSYAQPLKSPATAEQRENVKKEYNSDKMSHFCK